MKTINKILNVIPVISLLVETAKNLFSDKIEIYVSTYFGNVENISQNVQIINNLNPHELELLMSKVLSSSQFKDYLLKGTRIFKLKKSQKNTLYIEAENLKRDGK